jgi:two-component system, cell cycle response regulator
MMTSNPYYRRSGFAPTEPARLERMPEPRAARVPVAPVLPAAPPVAPRAQTFTATTMLTAGSAAPALKLLVLGFNAVERQLLEGTVRVSERRSPRLQLVGEADLESADVIMIDTKDAEAKAWARQMPALGRKAVIWVDGTTADPGHTLARRPVQWPILPILLARALEQGPGTQQKRPADPAPGTSARPATPDVRPVLVVDDSLAVRAYLRSLLEARGFHVAEAEHAQAAIEAVAQTAYACVLMDVLMPGIDGYEGCKQIKARLRGAASVPIIMLTSKSSPFDRIRGKMAGCDAYLTKPVDAQQLHDVLAQHVAGSAECSARAAAALRPAPTFSSRIATLY